VSNNPDNDRFLFLFENLSKEFLGMRRDIHEVLVCVGSFKERMDNIENRCNRSDKEQARQIDEMSKIKESITILECDSTRRNDMKKGLGFPIFNAVIIATIFAIFGAGAGITLIHLNELQKTEIERPIRN